jgi:predicted CoA-binding protein
VYPGADLWGRQPAATLAELRRPIDVVDVFRRSETLSAHVPDILAMEPLPKVVWFQKGVRDDAVAARLVGAGIDVVQDECMLALHKKFGLDRQETAASP